MTVDIRVAQERNVVRSLLKYFEEETIYDVEAGTYKTLKQLHSGLKIQNREYATLKWEEVKVPVMIYELTDLTTEKRYFGEGEALDIFGWEINVFAKNAKQRDLIAGQLRILLEGANIKVYDYDDVDKPHIGWLQTFDVAVRPVALLPPAGMEQEQFRIVINFRSELLKWAD